jgi:hypothetical protein
VFSLKLEGQRWTEEREIRMMDDLMVEVVDGWWVGSSDCWQVERHEESEGCLYQVKSSQICLYPRNLSGPGKILTDSLAPTPHRTKPYIISEGEWSLKFP